MPSGEYLLTTEAKREAYEKEFDYLATKLDRRISADERKDRERLMWLKAVLGRIAWAKPANDWPETFMRPEPPK